MFYPDAGIAGVELLAREGIEVLYPQNQACCGQPAYSSGYHDQVRSVARAQLDLFPGNWPITVPGMILFTSGLPAAKGLAGRVGAGRRLLKATDRQPTAQTKTVFSLA